MHEKRFSRAAAMMRRALVLMGLALLPAPALAQYIGGAPPPLPAPPRPGEVQTPAGALARAIRMVAQSPRDFNALIAAGRAALMLGDTQAAIGFFGRAEEVRPSDPAPKIGMGAATVVTGDASGALRWFYEAQRLGATTMALGVDRGLAQDLLGNQASAQVDYRAALGGREADEARRRLALSLGISGNRTAAFTVLQPLLQRRDPAAQRSRAFVLALVGDERGASSAIDQAMPGTGSRMAGFFRLLPTLSASQKAAAVHLGIFPDPSEIRVAAVSPRLIATPPVPRSAPRTVPARPRPAPPTADPTPLPLPPPAARAAPVIEPQPGFSTSAAAPVTRVPLDVPSTGPVIPDAPVEPATAVPLPAPATPLAEAPVAVDAGLDPTPSIVALSGDRLSGIDRLLSQADELPVPPAPRPRFETPTPASVDLAETVDAADLKKAADTRKAADLKKAADTRKAADLRKVADAKKAAERKKIAEEKEAREAIGLAGTNWVQLAGGSNADRMGYELKRLGAKSATLRKRGGAVTEGKDYFRLLTGPFATRAQAQAFVNQLAKDGVDGFSWTRTPATIKIEKLSPE